MQKIRLTLLVLFAASMALLGQHGGKADNMERLIQSMNLKDKEQMESVKALVQLNAVALNFKMLGVTRPDKPNEVSFRPATGIRWERMRGDSGFEPLLWSDFFTGAMVLPGPFKQDSAISALYNPWWDAMLLLKLERQESGLFQISSFSMQSGETFRGEPVAGTPSFESIVSQKKRQALVWMELVAKTRAAYESKYGNEDELDRVVFDDGFAEESRTPVQLRALLRMKLLQEMLASKGVAMEMISYLRILRKATANQAKEVFPAVDDIKMFALLTVLGPGFRKELTTYGYWGSEEERLYLYVCSSSPKIVCMVYVHAGKNAEFEWFNLDSSEKYIALDAKEAGK